MNDLKFKQKFIRGNKKVFDVIYNDYSDAMYAICLRYTKNTDEAADMLQDAFVKVYEKRKLFNVKYELGGWIKKIVINTAITHYNKNKKIVLVSDNSFYENELKDEYEISTNNQEKLREQLIQVLQKLPDGYRIIFNMFVIENLTHAEIANYLNISENTSKSQLSRAKKLIKKLLINESDTIKKKQINAERA